MSGQIFISYRREDSSGETGRIYDRLEQHFGQNNIFMDVDTIKLGVDFVKEIEDAVNKANIFLVIIGPNWLNLKDSLGKRRLDNPDDLVRLEVGIALKRGAPVIPVLVKEAKMPSSSDLPNDLQALARRNALEISHTRFSMDVERLIRAIEQALPFWSKEKYFWEGVRFAPHLSSASSRSGQGMTITHKREFDLNNCEAKLITAKLVEGKPDYLFAENHLPATLPWIINNKPVWGKTDIRPYEPVILSVAILSLTSHVANFHLDVENNQQWVRIFPGLYKADIWIYASYKEKPLPPKILTCKIHYDGKKSLSVGDIKDKFT